MKEKKKNLILQTKTQNVDEQGIVTVAVNGIGIEDCQGDISMPGSFDNTLKNDMQRMRWLLNHDITQLLGVPLEGCEKDGNLVMVGKINLNKQIGRDTYADYKLFAENGRTLEHSIGVIAMQRDEADTRKVLEWKMYEYSTLTGWGANPQTFLVDLKSATREQVTDAIEFLQKALKQPEYSDHRLKLLDMQLNLLLKSINGGTIATCPHCGHVFDYDAQEQHTVSQEIAELAAMYTRWIVEDTVYSEINNLKPEIQSEVVSILDTLKAQGKEATEKNVTDLMSYVRCPHCWGRVYKSTIGKPEEGGEKPEEEPKEKASSFSSLLARINKHI